MWERTETGSVSFVKIKNREGLLAIHVRASLALHGPAVKLRSAAAQRKGAGSCDLEDRSVARTSGSNCRVSTDMRKDNKSTCLMSPHPNRTKDLICKPCNISIRAYVSTNDCSVNLRRLGHSLILESVALSAASHMLPLGRMKHSRTRQAIEGEAKNASLSFTSCRCSVKESDGSLDGSK